MVLGWHTQAFPLIPLVSVLGILGAQCPAADNINYTRPFGQKPSSSH